MIEKFNIKKNKFKFTKFNKILMYFLDYQKMMNIFSKFIEDKHDHLVKWLFSIIFIFLLFVWPANAGTFTTEFPGGLTIQKMNYEYDHLGIDKNISIEILQSGDANYQAYYNITHFSSGWTECDYIDGKFEECRNITGCSEINYIFLDVPIFPDYNPEIGIIIDPDTFVDKNKSGLDTEVPVLHLFFNTPNFTCGKSLHFTIKYQMRNFIQKDSELQLYNLGTIEGFKIPPLSIYKYVQFNERVVFPFSRKATENEYYIPYVAFPLNGTTYDRTMEVRILQDEPLILEFHKEINKSDEPLVMLIFFDLLEKPKLQLVHKDILNLRKKTIERDVKITNLYFNRDLHYIENLDENNKKIYEILQQNNQTEYEQGKIPYKLPPGDTTTIDLESERIELKYPRGLKFLLQYPFDSIEIDKEFIVGNYLITDVDVPTDFDVYYNLCIEDASPYELNSDESYSELLPTEQLRFKTSYLGILGSGDFYGLSSYIDSPKRVNFEGQCSQRINMTINVPVSEAKIHNHLVFQRNWFFKWIPIFLGIFIPIISFILRQNVAKNNNLIISHIIKPEVAKNKTKYYFRILLITITISGISTFFNLQNLVRFDENIILLFHKGLWIFIILIYICWKKDNKIIAD